MLLVVREQRAPRAEVREQVAPAHLLLHEHGEHVRLRREERRRVRGAAEVRARERLQAAARGRLGDVDEVSLEDGAPRALEVRAQAAHRVGALRVVGDARAQRRVLGQAELSIYLRAG